MPEAEEAPPASSSPPPARRAEVRRLADHADRPPRSSPGVRKENSRCVHLGVGREVTVHLVEAGDRHLPPPAARTQNEV
jgi:hypothetical protein